VYDVALITGLPVYEKSVLFEHNEVTGEVEELLKGAMANHVSRERRRRRTMVKDMRMYRNYVSVLLELYRLNNIIEIVGTFTNCKRCWLLVGCCSLDVPKVWRGI